MIVAHEIQQLGLGGAEKTMLLFLRHLRALGVEELHAFSPRRRETERAGQVAEVAELHLYDDLDELARELRRLRPHVLHRHRSGYADPLDQVELDPRTRIVETNVYGDHGSRADLRLFVSRTVARERDWPGPVDVLHNPCEPPFPDAAVSRPYRRFPGVAERDVEKVLVFGRVGRPSAHIYDPIALEAYAQVESPWTRYMALAPPPNMLDHAEWLGLETFLPVPPTTDDRELSRFYSLIDVLAHARRDGETCGMNIQEAMIHGLPVITHLSDTHNAQPEILGEGYPWIAPRGDRDAYARFMREAIASPARRAELGRRNRERAAAEFEARKVTQRLLAHYRRLAQPELAAAPLPRPAAAPGRPPLVAIDEDLLLELYQRYRQDLVRLNHRMRALGFVGMFGDAEGELLYLLARHTRPKVVFEASPHEGWTSCYLLYALEDNAAGTLYSFDLHARWESRIPPQLKARRRFHCGDLRASLERVPAEIDLCLIDSDHSYEFATWYIEHLWPRVRPGGVCAVHDVYDTNLATFDANRGSRTEVSAVL